MKIIIRMKIHYTKDQTGKDILCDESGDKQVMMEWEKEYMEECIKRLQPKGHVLEIGFGFGYSATAIVNSPGVTEYTVIECSPEVWKNFENFRQKYEKNIKINLVRGRWEDMLYTLGKFDSCFFDDYQNTGVDIFRFENNFIEEFMRNHAVTGTRLGFYSTTDFKKNVEMHSSYLSLELEDYNVVIPENCRYAKKVFIPIVTKISDNVIVKKQENKYGELINGPHFVAHTPEHISHWDRQNNSSDTRARIIVIDNFYCNPSDTLNYINEYKITELPIGDTHKTLFEKCIGTQLKTEGPSQLIRNKELSAPEVEQSKYKWVGILFFSKIPPHSTGIQFFTNLVHTEYIDFDDIHRSFAKTDFIQFRMNRLVLFSGDSYHMIIDNFKSSLTQRFYFNEQAIN